MVYFYLLTSGRVIQPIGGAPGHMIGEDIETKERLEYSQAEIAAKRKPEGIKDLFAMSFVYKQKPASITPGVMIQEGFVSEIEQQELQAWQQKQSKTHPAAASPQKVAEAAARGFFGFGGGKPSGEGGAPTEEYVSETTTATSTGGGTTTRTSGYTTRGYAAFGYGVTTPTTTPSGETMTPTTEGGVTVTRTTSGYTTKKPIFGGGMPGDYGTSDGGDIFVSETRTPTTGAGTTTTRVSPGIGTTTKTTPSYEAAIRTSATQVKTSGYHGLGDEYLNKVFTGTQKAIDWMNQPVDFMLEQWQPKEEYLITSRNLFPGGYVQTKKKIGEREQYPIISPFVRGAIGTVSFGTRYVPTTVLDLTIGKKTSFGVIGENVVGITEGLSFAIKEPLRGIPEIAGSALTMKAASKFLWSAPAEIKTQDVSGYFRKMQGDFEKWIEPYTRKVRQLPWEEIRIKELAETEKRVSGLSAGEAAKTEFATFEVPKVERVYSVEELQSLAKGIHEEFVNPDVISGAADVRTFDVAADVIKKNRWAVVIPEVDMAKLIDFRGTTTGKSGITISVKGTTLREMSQKVTFLKPFELPEMKLIDGGVKVGKTTLPVSKRTPLVFEPKLVKIPEWMFETPKGMEVITENIVETKPFYPVIAAQAPIIKEPFIPMFFAPRKVQTISYPEGVFAGFPKQAEELWTRYDRQMAVIFEPPMLPDKGGRNLISPRFRLPSATDFGITSRQDERQEQEHVQAMTPAEMTRPSEMTRIMTTTVLRPPRLELKPYEYTPVIPIVRKEAYMTRKRVTSTTPNGFVPWIKKYGHWIPITNKAYSLQGALAEAAHFVEHTSVASFRIKPVEAPKIYSSAYKFNPKRFYKQGDTFIEYSKYRINTRGELAEISYKGAKAARRGRPRIKIWR